MLNIQQFTKTYGEKRAVDDLSLHIAPGEIYGFIGHNGAGKTTTLKAAVGILQFDAGEITIGGHSIQTEPLACKRLLAYIPDMEVVDNASDENNENTRRKATVVPIKIEYV